MATAHNVALSRIYLWWAEVGKKWGLTQPLFDKLVLNSAQVRLYRGKGGCSSDFDGMQVPRRGRIT